MTRKRIGVLAGAAVIAAIGIGVGVAVAAGGPSGRPGPAGATAGPGYSWYHSMMGRYTRWLDDGRTVQRLDVGPRGIPLDDGRDQRARLDARRHDRHLHRHQQLMPWTPPNRRGR